MPLKTKPTNKIDLGWKECELPHPYFDVMNKQYEGAYIWKCYTCLNLHWIKKVDTKHIHYAKYVGLWVPRARHFLFKLDRRAAVKNSWLFLFIRWWQRHRGLMGDINFQPITRAMTEWMKKRGTTSPRDSEIRREVTKNPHFSKNVQIFLCDFVPDFKNWILDEF